MFELNFSPPGPVAARFMNAVDYTRIMIGPVGSGKSSACAVEAFRRSLEQHPVKPNGLRHVKGLVVRATTIELLATTIPTWLQWFPEDVFGRLNRQPPITHHLRFGDYYLQVLFMGLDETSIDKVRSLEVTWAWINEARELTKPTFDAVAERTNRFPARRDGGAARAFVIADTNAPHQEHWINIMAGITAAPVWMPAEEKRRLVKPQDWSFFVQPPALKRVLDEDQRPTYVVNPEAENLGNLNEGYYQRLWSGKSELYINNMLMNMPGRSLAGRPVFPTFARARHVSPVPLTHDPALDLHVGLDTSRNPAAIFGQRTREGRWRILAELIDQNTSLRRFMLDRFLPFVAEHFPMFVAARPRDLTPAMGDELLTDEVAVFNEAVRAWRLSLSMFVWLDPAGKQRSELEDRAALQIVQACRVQAFLAPSNAPQVRLEAVDRVLDSGRITIDPECTRLIAGFEGGYHFRERAGSLKGSYDPSPMKNEYSHPHDGLQYMLLGAGEAMEVLMPPHMRGGLGTVIAKKGRPWEASQTHGVR